MRLRLACVVVALCGAGCGTFVTATEINDSPRDLTPRSPGRIPVFSSGPPERPHVDVAILEVEQTHSFNEQGTDLMIRRLREQAGQIGCDAIVLGSFRDHDGGKRGSGWDLLDPAATILHATCVVYRGDPSVRRVVAPSPPDLTAEHQRLDAEDPRL